MLKGFQAFDASFCLGVFVFKFMFDLSVAMDSMFILLYEQYRCTMSIC